MSTKLLDSFDAVYRLLEQPRAARRAVASLLVFHTALLGYSDYVHSPTLDEPAHLVAGLCNWKFGRFELYRVNPPLVRMVAALPVAVVGYKMNWNNFYEHPGARAEFTMGEDLIAANGKRSLFLMMIARWACIPFSWIGAIFCFLWGRDLSGRTAGVLASTLWCFEPNILAHASLITADTAATSIGLAATYTFWCWLKQPTWKLTVITGVVLGMAELTKTTLVIFYPLWPSMWFIYRCWARNFSVRRHWMRESGMLATQILIGFYVLNLAYGFDGAFTRIKDYEFVSDLLTSPETIPPIGHEQEVRNAIRTNRFGRSLIGELPVPLPKNYVLGFDIQQHDFEHANRASYLRGQWQDRGWLYYYFYACAIKIPLGLWTLGGLLLAGKIWFALLSRKNKVDDVFAHFQWRNNFILLMPAVTIFTVASFKTGFSEHLRYVLPSFPYVFIGISQIVRRHWRKCYEAEKCLTVYTTRSYNSPTSVGGRTNDFRSYAPSLFGVGILGCLLWIVVSSLWVYPHSLAYFNELIGGPLRGPEHLLGSNVDWGQDLLYVNQIDLPRAGPEFHVYAAFFGSYSPTAIGIQDLQRIPQVNDRLRVLPGYYAISINLLYGFNGLARDGNDSAKRLDTDEIEALRSLPIVKYAGYSIRIYRAEN